MPYEPTDDEWSVIKPMLPNKPRGRGPTEILSLTYIGKKSYK
jgi:hypothetical protein